MKIGEIFCIIILFIIYYLSFDVDNTDIRNLNHFNHKIMSTFDENTYCNEQFLKMTSHFEIDNWTTNCYRRM